MAGSRRSRPETGCGTVEEEVVDDDNEEDI
jgi:hypothetical protein